MAKHRKGPDMVEAHAHTLKIERTRTQARVEGVGALLGWAVCYEYLPISELLQEHVLRTYHG